MEYHFSLEDVKKVISLANESREKYRFFEHTYFPSGSMGPADFLGYRDSVEYQRYKNLDKALNDYLMNLSFEEIKDLQTLMYLGRDYDVDENKIPASQYFQELRKDFDTRWKTQKIEVNQMTEKLPLGDYLTTGLKLLNLN